MFILFLSTIAYLTPAATAFGNVGWKYYLLFIVLTVINTPIVWYVFPETKGLSLEEIGEKFGDEVVVHLADIAGERREHLDQESFSQDEKPVPISAPQHIETVETGSIE
ncbi:hypothetical protein Plec18167_009097 [Paecilomyces lecythidis]|uniref:Major facilitator superfamily (MFS) profile domain-containing protein n=1 Tax=Paecilomyces lecythidis TaxID=3004212 RepID=A0ABR3WS24_9EURO